MAVGLRGVPNTTLAGSVVSATPTANIAAADLPEGSLIKLPMTDKDRLFRFVGCNAVDYPGMATFILETLETTFYRSGSQWINLCTPFYDKFTDMVKAVIQQTVWKYQNYSTLSTYQNYVGVLPICNFGAYSYGGVAVNDGTPFPYLERAQENRISRTADGAAQIYATASRMTRSSGGHPLDLYVDQNGNLTFHNTITTGKDMYFRPAINLPMGQLFAGGPNPDGSYNLIV